MNEFFGGTINKLVIFAAPCGSGKSTFLTNPTRFISQESLPSQFADLQKQAPNFSHLINLHQRPEKYFDVLYLHLDLFRPMLALKDYPHTRKTLLDRIDTDLFASWEAWVRYSKMAKEVHVITMFVSREEHYRRWIFRRALADKKPKWVLNLTAALIGDSTNNSEIHRRYHQMWQEVVGNLNPTSNHVLDASGSRYKFLSIDEFKTLIEEGY